MKKKIWCRTDWATAQLYCEKKKKIVLQGWIVLQPRGKLYCDNRFCIAIIEIVLQSRQLGWAGSVLQYIGLYCREES